ncbi:MAG: thrombospondin type 3 repeat-containing protein, partial [Thermoleophilaceae bacterium]
DVTAVGGSGSYSLTVLPDIDGDVLPDGEDNCRTRANPAQTDRDRDSLGDACDRFPRDPRNDRDRDGLGANADYCPRAANRGQRDWDRDGQGDRCDRSSRLTLKVIRARGLRVTVRATLRPSLLGPRALTASLYRRACATCAFKRVSRVAKERGRGKGRVDFTVTLRRGAEHRLRAVVRDRRYKTARARPLVLPVR